MAEAESGEGVGDRQAHPSREVLARVLSGTAEPDEVRQEVLRHLVACCGECRRRVEGLEALGREFGHWDVAEAMTEWREAPRLWRRIAALPYEQQVAAIEADEDFFTWGMCRFLQLLSVEEVGARAARADELANLAVRVAGKLGETYDVTWVRGLRALCLACLGNARRALGEMQGAADALLAARELVAAGVGNAAFEAEVLVIAGLVARDRRRLGEAVELFEAAQEAASRPDSEVRDGHLDGVALAEEAWCRYQLGDAAAAAVRLEEASRLVDAARDPGLAWEVGLGRVWAALSLGRLEEARRLAAAARAATGGGGDDGGGGGGGSDGDGGERGEGAAGSRGGSGSGGGRGRRAAVLRRAEARIAAASGEQEEAERTLLAAVGELLAGGQGVEAALALIDVAVLLVEAGEAQADRRLSAVAVELVPEVMVRGADLTVADVAALLRLERRCLVQPLEGVRAAERRRAAAPPAVEAKAAAVEATAAGEVSGPVAWGEPGETEVSAPGESEVAAPDEEGHGGKERGDGTEGGVGDAPAAAGGVEQLSAAVLRELVAEIEGRRRPGLGWWSGLVAAATGGVTGEGP